MPNEEVAEGSIRVHVKCPFCQQFWEEVVLDEEFGRERRNLKAFAGSHIMHAHPERIFEIAVVMAGPFQEFVVARIDGSRREGRALTELQRAANDLRLP